MRSARAIALLPDGLQLGDGLEILPPSGGALQPDEGVEGHAQAVDAEDVDARINHVEVECESRTVVPRRGDASNDDELNLLSLQRPQRSGKSVTCRKPRARLAAAPRRTPEVS